MPVVHPPIEPLRTDFALKGLSSDQLEQLQMATLNILENVGVRFPSKKALQIFADHGAEVDQGTDIVKMSPDLVWKALSTVPRYFTLGARKPNFDLHLEENVSYFTTDGCGYETIDFVTGKRSPSTKADVGQMAQVADYLSSISFYWTMVSAQIAAALRHCMNWKSPGPTQLSMSNP